MPSGLDRAQEGLRGAVEVLARGGLVAFPTETVWGIAADARSAAAVRRLRTFKGRDASQPISLIVSGPSALPALGCDREVRASALMDAFWPGPLTLVLPCLGEGLAEGIVNAEGGLGIRCSPHPVALALAVAAEGAGLGPLTATSCNERGAPPAATREEARAVCDGGQGAPMVVEIGEDAHGAAVSSVLDLCRETERLLRVGAVSERQIRDVLVKITGAPTLDGDERLGLRDTDG